MQADGRIGVYMIGGRDGCSPVGLPDRLIGVMFNVFFEADETAIPQILQRNDPAKSRVFPYCLSERNGPGTFYLNYDPFTSSLLRPSTEFDITAWHASRDYQHAVTCRPVREIPVELRTLDSLHLLDDPAVAPPTVMVLDTQGTELAIMRGGWNLIAEHTMAIVTEAEFIRFYEGQPLFGDICAALEKLGFMFVDFTSGLHRADLHRAPLGLRSRSTVAYCDALFLRKPASISQPLHLAQLAFVSQLYAQMGYGFHCLDLLLKTDPQLTVIPAERAYRGFLLELDAARQAMPIVFAPGFKDLYPTFERSNERFDAAVTVETQIEHRDAEYAKIQARLAAQQADVVALLSSNDTPVEAVIRKYGLIYLAQACKDRRIAEMTEMLAELGVQVERQP
jgi:FkbM family methyltransferase